MSGRERSRPTIQEARRFAALIEPHLDALFRAAYRLCRSVPDAEDLVQDVCLRVYDRRGQLERADSPRAWLLRVQLNLHIDAAWRRRAVAEPLDDERHGARPLPGPDEQGPGEHAEAARLAEMLNRGWRLLTPDQQALLALYAEGYSLAEMIEITGVPLGALKARLHRARARLGSLLDADRQPPRIAAVSGESR